MRTRFQVPLKLHRQPNLHYPIPIQTKGIFSMPFKSVLSSGPRRKKAPSTKSRSSTSSTPPLTLPNSTYAPPGNPTYPVHPVPPPLYTPLAEVPTITPDPFHLPSELFILSASIVIFEPETARVVVIHDEASNVWMLPRGRKDRGESISACALREGMEESGYAAQLLTYTGGTLQPRGEDVQANEDDHSEAFWIQGLRYHRWIRQRRKKEKNQTNQEDDVILTEDVGEDEELVTTPSLSTFLYLTFYFLATMNPGQVPTPKLIGNHEMQYVTHLLPIDEAIVALTGGVGNGMVFVPPAPSSSTTNDPKSAVENWKEYIDAGKESGEIHVLDTLSPDHEVTYHLDAEKAVDQHKKVSSSTSEEGAVGGLYPNPANGADDGAVQAMVVRQGWQVLQREMKKYNSSVAGFAPGGVHDTTSNSVATSVILEARVEDVVVPSNN
ncbi:hypothetical protein DFH27DRAFT_580665 [Peziza echinospora]|nr:hypothetical protein DFH27DRAFT_580665 [Peziza echinospora]